MKWLFTIFLLGTTLFVLSQSDNLTKNGIGLNLSESGTDGAGLSIRYTKQTKIGGILKFEINSNFRRAYHARFGFEFLQLHFKKFGIGMGFDLKYSYLDISDYSPSDYNYFSIELPIEARYKFSPKYNVFTGLSFSKKVWSNSPFLSASERADLRVGIMYNF